MIRILVVDDDSGHRLILKNRLTELGSEVIGADSGARGLVEARGGKFDVFVVSALLGSGIDGLEVTHRLKSIPETNHVPVILFHNQSGATEVVQRGYEAGCDAFVTGQELNGLDHVIRLLVKSRREITDLNERLRGVQEQLQRRGAGGDRAREPDPAVRDGAEVQAALRELAAGRPDGVLLVDGEGTVRHADRGACELLGARPEGRHLGSLVPASGLEAFVRDARIECREGFRFDVNHRRGRPPRTLCALVVPFVFLAGEHDHGQRIVLFQDATRRRMAADYLRVAERGIPRAELGPLLDAAREVYRVDRLLGETPPMTALREGVARAIQCSSALFLEGPPGSGRERVARTVHFNCLSTGAFVAFACEALANGDADLELFGYAKGAFPGALSDRLGLCHLAQDGTLYLSEIGSLALPTQAKLATLVREGTVVRAGTRKPERVDVRVVASSRVPLAELLARGRIDPELAERLSEIRLRVPGLQERAADLPLLARTFLQRHGDRRQVRDLGADALSLLGRHDWPGNLDELDDVLGHACARAENGVVRAHDLPRALIERLGELPSRDLIPMRRPDGPPASGTHSVTGAQASPSIPVHLRTPERDARPWDITDEDPVSLDLYEKKALLRALDQVGGDRLAAARLLKVGKSTLYRKLKRFGIH
jgi:DNA-binding NtrC family response regulator